MFKERDKKMESAIKQDAFIEKAKRVIRNNGPLIVLIILFIFASLYYKYFFTWINIRNVLRQVSMLGIVSLGLTTVILIGGIDLSVGAILAVSGVWAANLSEYGLFVCISIPLLMGLGMGLINGVLVTKMNIIPFITTLATMIGMRGVAHLSTGEVSIRIAPLAAGFSKLGRSYLFGIPLPTVIFIGLVILFSIFARYAKLGRAIYAVGNNEEAALMMGVNVKRVKVFAYAVSGFLAAFAGIILASRLGAGQPVAGQGWEMDAIASVVIGGTLMTGGKGRYVNTLCGVLIIGIITNMFNMDRNINAWWEGVVKGLIVLVAIILQAKYNKKTTAKK